MYSTMFFYLAFYTVLHTTNTSTAHSSLHYYNCCSFAILYIHTYSVLCLLLVYVPCFLPRILLRTTVQTHVPHTPTYNCSMAILCILLLTVTVCRKLLHTSTISLYAFNFCTIFFYIAYYFSYYKRIYLILLHTNVVW